jgi:oxygen-independent coproporphyrinogen-3 oxidase
MPETQLKKLRQNIHTYPFKYKYLDPNEFFTPERGSIYIHIPFCSKKCHFCDYTVYINKTDDAREQYVQRLVKEIQRFPDLGPFPRYKIDAVYFGGGTPGLLEADQLLRILNACRDTFEFVDDAEICIEFDPKSVTLEKLQAIHEGGVTRLSIGVQTFNRKILELCNRPHDATDVENAVDAMVRSGFKHTNIDLIYPLPELTEEIWQDSVKRALALNPACITLYGLELWPGTAYYNWWKKGKLNLPTNEQEVWMYSWGTQQLLDAGYKPRSTSGYYHPERSSEYCRFLDYYWRTWPMIGFGVSSKSVVGNRLWTNVKPLNDYMNRIDKGESVMDFATYLDKPGEMRRVMIRGLKMCEVGKPEFYQRFGVSMETVFGKEIQELVEDGLLENDEERIVLTPKGRTFGPNVYQKFYTEHDTSPVQQGEVQFGISEIISD